MQLKPAYGGSLHLVSHTDLSRYIPPAKVSSMANRQISMRRNPSEQRDKASLRTIEANK